MKKHIALALALVILGTTFISGFSILAVDLPLIGNTKLSVVTNFENGVIDGMGWQGLGVITSNKGYNNSKGYAINRNSNCEWAGGWRELLFFSGVEKNFNGAESVQYYVKNEGTSNYDMTFRFYLVKADGKVVVASLKTGTTYFSATKGDSLWAQNTSISQTFGSNTYGLIRIPAGYEGFIRIPTAPENYFYLTDIGDAVDAQYQTIDFSTDKVLRVTGQTIFRGVSASEYFYVDDLSIVGANVASTISEQTYFRPYFSTAVVNKTKVITDFESGVTGGMGWSSVGVITDSKGFNSSKSYGINRSNCNFSTGWKELIFFHDASGKSLKGAESVQFYVKNEGTVNFFMTFRLWLKKASNGAMAIVDVKSNTTYYLAAKNQSAWQQATTAVYSGSTGCVTVPAGFEGFISIPMISSNFLFQPYGSPTLLEEDKKFNFDTDLVIRATNFATIFQGATANENFYIDDFAISGKNVNALSGVFEKSYFGGFILNKPGDGDNNNLLQVNDLAIAKNILLNNGTISNETKLLSDFNGDGYNTISDLIAIKKTLLSQ